MLLPTLKFARRSFLGPISGTLGRPSPSKPLHEAPDGVSEAFEFEDGGIVCTFGGQRLDSRRSLEFWFPLSICSCRAAVSTTGGG